MHVNTYIYIYIDVYVGTPQICLQMIFENYVGLRLVGSLEFLDSLGSSRLKAETQLGSSRPGWPEAALCRGPTLALAIQNKDQTVRNMYIYIR